MTAIIPILTQAGIQAVFNANNTGLQAEITHIALGNAGYTPSDSATALQSEKQRVAVSGGEMISNDQIHLTANASGNAEYWIKEVGFYLADGTLLAVYSDPIKAIAYKSSSLDILLSFDLKLSALPADSITIDGSGGLSLPPATNTKQGLMRFATDSEAVAGTLETVSINPKQLQSNIASLEVITAGSITTPKLALGAVGAEQIGNNAVTNPKIADGAVTSNKLAAGLTPAHPIRLDANTHINNIRTAGFYTCDYNQTAAAIAAPSNAAGSLEVKYTTGEHGIVQIYRTYGVYEPRTYTRTIYEDDNIAGWATPWQRLDSAPVGSVIASAVNAGGINSGYLPCNGAAVSRTVYIDLFNHIGTNYGAGDGSTTFNIPDYRGVFLRGIDEGRGLDPNRAFASYQDDEIKSHRHKLGIPEDTNGIGNNKALNSSSGNDEGVAFNHYSDIQGGSETRPKNMPVIYFIKY